MQQRKPPSVALLEVLTKKKPWQRLMQQRNPLLPVQFLGYCSKIHGLLPLTGLTSRKYHHFAVTVICRHIWHPRKSRTSRLPCELQVYDNRVANCRMNIQIEDLQRDCSRIFHPGTTMHLDLCFAPVALMMLRKSNPASYENPYQIRLPKSLSTK